MPPELTLQEQLENAERLNEELDQKCRILQAQVGGLERRLTDVQRDRAEMAERYDVAVMTIRAQAAGIVEMTK